jgi:Bacterial protein of unknown function (DUF922)
VATHENRVGIATARCRTRRVRICAFFFLIAMECPAAAQRIVVRAVPPRLAWADFRHVDSIPGSSEDARIAAEISFPRPLRMERIDDRYRLPPFTISVAPRPEGTMVLRTAVSSPLLRHEQGHYDIVVLVARALARELESITAASPDELRRRVEEQVDEHTARARSLSALYDRETEGSTDVQAQARWEAEIAAALKRRPAKHLRRLPL